MIAQHPVWLLWQGKEARNVLALRLEPDYLHIFSVAVHPQDQKYGFGCRLLNWAELEAQRYVRQEIHLLTNALMVENIALYLRLGYIEIGREPYLGSTVVYMAKKLEK